MVRLSQGLYNRPMRGGIGYISADLKTASELIDVNASEYLLHNPQDKMAENEKYEEEGEVFELI